MQGIVKDFYFDDRHVRVLNNIDLQLHSGQMTLLVGPSGCGKTTLLSILTGIMAPTAGTVTFGDTCITSLGKQQNVLFRRKEIGFVFQQYNLLPSLTAVENAAITLVAAGISMTEAKKKSAALLTQLNMQQFLNKYPSQMSGGEQQRVAIARALLHEPRVIVCDEPTSALDATTGLHIMEILKQISTVRKHTVVVVTHDNRIFHFANQIIYMADGQIVRDERR